MRSPRTRSAQRSYRRAIRTRLFLEPLEDRRLLATFVDAVNDSVATSEDTPLAISVLANDTSDTPWSSAKVVSVSQPANGSAAINFDRTVTYTPAANFAGTDTFTYTIWDSSSQLLQVTPGRSSFDLHARANSSTQTSTMDYDARTNSQTGTVSMLRSSVYAESAFNGTVRMGAYGEATWTSPAQGQVFLNNVVFDRLSSYEGSASLVEGSGWTYQFTPATSGMFILDHDIRMTNTFGLYDLGEFRLGWSHGTTNTFQLINADNRANAFGQTALPVQGGVTYTVSLYSNFSLAWGSPFSVTDREALSALFSFRIVETPLADTATVTVTVGAVGDSPIAQGWQFGTDQDVPLHEFLRASDADGDPLRYSVVENPGHGSLTVNPSTGTFDYTPQAGYTGTDTFTYQVNDGTSDSNVARIYVTVRKPNHPPVANDDFAMTSEETTVDISWWSNDSDPNGETPSLVSFTEPANGTVTLGVSAPFFRYTPNPNFSGTDTFSYTIKDRAGLQDTATVTVSVGDVDDPPAANPLTLSTNEDSATTGQVSGSDEESAVTFAVANGPTSGVLSLFNTQTGEFVYTPKANFHGTDTFTFTASDGAQTSEPATVSITVRPVNDAPEAVELQFVTSEDTPLQQSLSGTDIDGDDLTYWIVDKPVSGSGIQINLDTGLFTYTPHANFAGDDRFTYRIHDGVRYSEVAEVRIRVTAVNDAPLAPGALLATDEEVSLSGILPASDAEGNALSYAVVQNPAHGTVTVDETTGAFVYTPERDYFGDDVFTYKVNDGQADSNIARILINVRNVNDPPVASDDSAVTNEDTDASVFVIANDTDADREFPTIASFSQGANGVVVRGVGAPFLRYTPHANFYGTDTFTYTIRDGAGTQATATVTVTVTAVNDPPMANSLQIATDEDQAATGRVSGSDVDSAVTFAVAAGPSHGSLTFNADGTFTYLPNANFHATDTFTFTASDGELLSPPATVTIAIAPVNDAPAAIGAAIVTDEDTPLQSTLSASDIDGDSLTYSLVDQPASGAVQLNASTGAFTYTPKANHFGADSFTFRVFDGQTYSEPVQVAVTVQAVNDPPTAVDQVFTLAENEPFGEVVGTFAAVDIEKTILSFAISQAEPAAFAINSSTGEITVANPALLDYEANPTLQFQVHVTDSDRGQSTASVTVNLTDVLEMAIDIVPGDSANRIDLGSSTVEVAILAGAGFAPLEEIDLGSLRLGRPGSTTGANVQSHPRHGFKYEQRDVNGDGRSDLVVKFSTSETGLRVGDTALQLSGKLKSGDAFLLEQAVTVFASSKGGSKGGGKGNGGKK